MYDDDAEHWVGKTFAGTWWIERVLGTGGMGSVLLGRAADGSQGRAQGAAPELNAITEVRKRFLREGFIGNTLGGADAVPGVVRVLGSGETQEGLAYLTMRRRSRETLFDRMARTGTMPAGEVLALADQVLETLAIAHRAASCTAISAREHPPRQRRARAHARLRHRARRRRAHRPAREDRVSKTGMIMGTATYSGAGASDGAHPRHRRAHRSFGLGATMFRLLAGRQVHGEVTEAMEVIAAATEAAPPLASDRARDRASVAAVVDRSLAFIKFCIATRTPRPCARTSALYAQARCLPTRRAGRHRGRIRAGQPISQPAPPLHAGGSPSARPQPTVVEPAAAPRHSHSMSFRPERTLDDNPSAPSRAGASLSQLSTASALSLLVGGALAHHGRHHVAVIVSSCWCSSR